MVKFEELVDIVAKLRAPDGCPWDREQTRETLIPYLIEEFYELIDAFDENDNGAIKEELGDLLFQIVLQSQLSKERGDFNIDDVIEEIAQKMISRHPHVFGDENLETSEDVKMWWEKQKMSEGKIHESIMDRVPRSLPALLRAHKLQIKATKVGFDWEKIEDVFAKLDEEIGEFREALGKKEHEEIEDELGDILFVLVRIANFVKVNPEDALRKTINKFLYRFRHIESEASLQGRNLSEMTLEEMDALWRAAKNENKG
jgi:tetrapyrrole methylase family protein/MazG family protein